MVKARPVTGGDDRLFLSRIELLHRKQLARHLHDGPIQSVAALAMRTDLTRRKLAADPQGIADELKKLDELAHRTARELRYLEFSLLPRALETGGLALALQDLVRQVGEIFSQAIQVNIEEQAAGSLSSEQQQLLFFIAAEALDNARKHAQARRIQLKLTLPQAGVVLLEVEDDGVGFEPKDFESEREGKYGLALLRERVNLIHAELDIISQAGMGAVLRVALPSGKPKQ